MKEYNVIAVLDAQGENVLMCLRRKPPYQGLWNLVGGKLEPGESGEEAAYRELFEETAIPRGELALWHVMDFVYHASSIRMEVWAGRLARPFAVHGEENALAWLPLTEDFFDCGRFAGDGNIGHILRHVLWGMPGERWGTPSPRPSEGGPSGPTSGPRRW